MRRIALLGIFLAVWPFASLAAQPAAPAGAVLEISLDGTVDPLSARYVERAIEHANDSGMRPFIRIDTPGGLESSMRAIVTAIGTAKVPAVCWVGPSGARAASAGAIVMLACPRAVMAPGTNIGAAHPVGFRGEVLDTKITNDAAAFARSLAEKNGRNTDVAERMVRDSLSLSAEEALQRDVIDAIAPTRASALGASASAIEPFRRSFVEGLLHGLFHPDLAFLLLVLGLAGIVFEVLHPGISVPGIVGSLSLITSLIVLGALPVNLAGLALIVAGIGLLVLEAYTPGVGIPAALGFAALLLGGLFLFDASIPSARVTPGLVAGTSLSVAALFAVMVRAVVKARRLPPSPATMDELVGEEGIVVRALVPEGIVRARNEEWSARSVTRHGVPEGARVRIVSAIGLKLEVEPIEAPVGFEGGGS